MKAWGDEWKEFCEMLIAYSDAHKAKNGVGSAARTINVIFNEVQEPFSVIERSDAELLRLPNFGRKSLKALRAVQAQFNKRHDPCLIMQSCQTW